MFFQFLVIMNRAAFNFLLFLHLTSLYCCILSGFLIEYVLGLLFFICSDNLYNLGGLFRPFILNVIIDIIRFRATILFGFIFLLLFYFFFSFLWII